MTNTGNKSNFQSASTVDTPASAVTNRSPGENVRTASSQEQNQSPTKTAANAETTANSKQKSIHDLIVSQKLKHENRIKSLERLIELEKQKAQKLQRIMSQPVHEQQHQSMSSSYIYESILNDEDSEYDLDTACSCYSCVMSANGQRRHPVEQTVGFNAAQMENTSRNPRQQVTQPNEKSEKSTSRERRIPIMVEKRAESWFYSVDNPKFHTKGDYFSHLMCFLVCALYLYRVK